MKRTLRHQKFLLKVIKISDAMDRLRQKGDLDDDAISALVCNMKGMSAVSKGTVRLVMNGLARLKSYYIRK